MKTKEELEILKEEYEILNEKLSNLTDDELKAVIGGIEPEEFDWKPKGYITPIKEEDEDDGDFHFHKYGN